MMVAPWYLRSDALAILADCAKDEPVTLCHTAQFALTRDEWRSYVGERAEQLEAIRLAVLTPLLQRVDTCALADGAGLMVTVDMAIDAVVSEPMCARNIHEMADVARVAAEIDLAHRRAA